jgi:hypothetical protein
MGTHWTRCTAERRNGSFCDAPSIPEAPFPICIRHAAEIYRFVKRHAAAVDDKLGRLETFVEAYANAGILTVSHGQPEPEKGTVYYVQVGELVKIGFSVSLKTRLASYPPNRRLLATEPGGWDLEGQRHGQFRSLLRYGKEWFAPGPELIDHINTLRRQVGAQPVVIRDAPRVA